MLVKILIIWLGIERISCKTTCRVSQGKWNIRFHSDDKTSTIFVIFRTVGMHSVQDLNFIKVVNMEGISSIKKYSFDFTVVF